MHSGMDSKDGLRELIEMRNNKRNNNRGLLNNYLNMNAEWSDDDDKDKFNTENNQTQNNGDAEVKEEIPDPIYYGNAQSEPTYPRDIQDHIADHAPPGPHDNENSDSDNYQERDMEPRPSEPTPDGYSDSPYDDQLQETSDSNLVPPDDAPVPMIMDNNQNPSDQDDQEPGAKESPQSEIWTLPAERNDCTLEEIRRGQVMNKTASNECPVLGCGKKINEMRIEPSPGTIASGLRTHVLFVHYANRKVTKKRKLGWSSLKRRNQPSPKKQVGPKSDMSSSKSKEDFDLGMEASYFNAPSLLQNSLDLTQRSVLPNRERQQAFRPNLLNTIQKLVRQPSAERASSIQNLIQITKANKQKNNVDTTAQPRTDKLNPTTSSLFSILAGLTQQQQTNQQLPSASRNIKTAQGSNTINISQCSRNPSNTSNSVNSRTVNSSLLSLLNEKISNNVSSSLQAHIKKNLAPDSRSKISTSSPMQSVLSPASTSHYPVNNECSTFNNSTSILSSLCSGNGDNRPTYDNSVPLNSFIESIALKTGSNIGQAGITEAKKILEKFTSALICSSQTIADHYLAPFGGDVPQQKSEISPSDVTLAYKMMHKSHGQP